MDGYQPKKTCDNCFYFDMCIMSKVGKDACWLYKGVQPAPPRTGSNVKFPTQNNVPPMPEIKPPKQRTVLSVRDFAILYEIANMKLMDIEANICQLGLSKEEALTNPYYQDLLRIRDKLGELNIEVETPSVEVEE